MGTFSTSTTIDAPVTAVWAALADVGNIYLWNPGVKASHLTSEQSEGNGTCRYCDLGGNNFLKEEVVTWELEQKLTMRITDTNMPFKTADIRFSLQPSYGKTIVTVSPIYTLKYGPIGQMIDWFMVKNTYQKGMQSLLKGLKTHIENSN